MSTIFSGSSDCKTAALHNMRTVQGTGVLIAVNAETQVIEYCSANFSELLGLAPAGLLGKTGAECWGDQWPALAGCAQREGALQFRDMPGPVPLSVTGHRRGAHHILEWEPGHSPERHWWDHSSRTRFLEALTKVHTVEQCREFLVRWVAERSGYDRVLMYRFLPEWHGEVVHEQCRPGVEGYLGLRFPASDIPPNARQLFTLNWQRAIVDVDSEPSPVLQLSEDSQALDLTYSTLRSAHPAHIQYLKNMGVAASLTLSLVIRGKLWGLIACHHLSPRALPIADRLAFEEMARIVALHLSNLLGLIEQETRAHVRGQLSTVRGAMTAAIDDARLALSHNLGAIRQTFGAGGGWLHYEGEDFFCGMTPDPLSLAPLRDFLERYPRDEVSFYNVVPEPLLPYRALAAHASGLLFIPLSGTDFLALMRPEVIDTVNWAGRPDFAQEYKPTATQQLTPRNSFAVWSQRVRNTAQPWTDCEIEHAATLRGEIQSFIGTARLEQIALHDSLTGLANRLLFERRLQQEVRTAMTRGTSFAVHMIDLDRFKNVNDTLGHAAGDELLCQVAARLKEQFRKGDTIARLGGDEFAILQAELDDRAVAFSLAQRVVQTLSEPFQISGQTVSIGASIGISMCPLDTVDEDELLECADAALYQVKRSGRNAVSLYVPDMRSTQVRGTDGEVLLHALNDNQFRLVYQPVVDARTGALRGLEAFLRWHQPDGVVLSAGEFMPAVEQKRLAPAFSEWVMDQVFRQYQQWLRQGLATVPLTVNVGVSEFTSQDLLSQIERLSNRYETGTHWLRLDVKEQALVTDIAHAIRKLGRLREIGVGANLDNFGRGFVPLGYLTQLPFRGVKLDGTLLSHKSDRQYFQALFNIVQTIAQVSSAQLTVTRVETPEFRDTLASLRIDYLQGYAIARPADAAQAADWLLHPDTPLISRAA